MTTIACIHDPLEERKNKTELNSSVRTKTALKIVRYPKGGMSGRCRKACGTTHTHVRRRRTFADDARSQTNRRAFADDTNGLRLSSSRRRQRVHFIEAEVFLWAPISQHDVRGRDECIQRCPVASPLGEEGGRGAPGNASLMSVRLLNFQEVTPRNDETQTTRTR